MKSSQKEYEKVKTLCFLEVDAHFTAWRGGARLDLQKMARYNVWIFSKAVPTLKEIAHFG